MTAMCSPSAPETADGALEAGIFFTLDELAVIFSRFKRNESILDNRERQVLNRIEKTLYEHLSIAEIEGRLGASLG